jgi:UDP-glucose:(heptosyl)LPS alpha-1,3-glucosyltransferase
LEIIQVVKRFGLCGGMEEYAYRLSNELCALGVKVMVVCEEKLNDPKDSNIETFELGKSLKKPRWLSHLLFAKKVRSWVMKNADKDAIVHSHERIDCHHFTTIHSTLYNFPPKQNFPSFRNYCNEHIERRELNCDSVQKIIPVSGLIADQITEKYSSARHKLAPPIPPGVSPLNTIKKESNPGVPVIGFMGKEWKRKGLPKVIEIWRELRKEIPLARLCVAGFTIDEPIGILEDEFKFVDLLGYVSRKEDFYEKIDILLHPAQREAYGMVIAEALSIGISVLCSKETGASTNQENGLCDSLPYDNPIQSWCKLVIKKLNSYPTNPSKIFCNSWSETAKDYKLAYKNVLLS